MIHYNIKQYLVTSMCIGFGILGLAGSPLAQAAANLDSTFGSNGVVLTPSTVNSDSLDVAIQSDGKIVTLFSGQLTRYNANGSLDNGFVTLGSPSYVYRAELALQTDGRIVTTGSALSRYNTTGNLDSTFGINGQVNTGSFSDVVLQSDGKIIAVKVTYLYTDWQGYARYSNELMRYNTNGVLDTTYGVNGVVNFGETAGFGVVHLAIQTDNKVLAGQGINNVSLTRLNVNGSVDSSFGTNGTAVVSYTPPITSQNSACLFYNGNLGLANIMVQSDGKIVVVGNSGQCDRQNVSHNEFSLARFNSNGSLDSAFGSGGKVVTPNANATGRALYDAALQTNGKIVGVGYIYDPKRNTSDFTIARYNADGSVDSTLTGITKIGLGSVSYGIAIQTDGKAVAGGSATGLNNSQNSALVRYLP